MYPWPHGVWIYKGFSPGGLAVGSSLITLPHSASPSNQHMQLGHPYTNLLWEGCSWERRKVHMNIQRCFMISSSTFTTLRFGVGDTYILQTEKKKFCGEYQKNGSQLCYDIVSQVSSCYASPGPLFKKCYYVEVAGFSKCELQILQKNIYRKKEF